MTEAHRNSLVDSKGTEVSPQIGNLEARTAGPPAPVATENRRVGGAAR